ncbi:MAG: IS66-like element accessory protein TnpA [Betaproteobacteria bacterium]
MDRLPSKLPISWQGARRGEVLPWPERRRRWSGEEKAQIVAESLAPNAVASAIARRYGLHRNQLYAWRKELSQTANRAAEAGRPAPLDFVPVVVTEERDVARASAIEIELSGARVRVSAGVDPALLENVLRTLKVLG